MRISDWSSDVCSSDLNPANHFSLLSPNQRYLLNVIGHYNLTDNITAFVEGSYAHTSGTKISDLFQFAAPNILGGPVLTMSADNPFISQQARDILIAHGADRKSVVEGTGLSGRVVLGGRRTNKKKKEK